MSPTNVVYTLIPGPHGHAMPRTRLASDAILDAAYGWLCKRRRDYPVDSDVWSLRWHWQTEKERIQTDLLAGRYLSGANVVGNSMLGTGSQVFGQITAGSCVLNPCERYCHLDPDRRESIGHL